MSLKLVLFSYIIFVLAVFVQPIEISFAVSEEPEISKSHNNHNRYRKNFPYSLHERESLRFGKIVSPENGTGSVEIDPCTGDKTVTGGVFDLGEDSGAAVFEIRARPGSQFNVSTPSEVLMRPKNSDVKIRDIKICPEGVLNVGLAGRMEFNIGGSLYLPSNTKSGDYRARIQVFIEHIIE